MELPDKAKLVSLSWFLNMCRSLKTDLNYQNVLFTQPLNLIIDAIQVIAVRVNALTSLYKANQHFY